MTPSSYSFQEPAASNKRTLELLPLLPQVTAFFDPFISATSSATTDGLYFKHITSTSCTTVQHFLRRVQPKLSPAQLTTSSVHQSPQPFIEHADQDSTVSPQHRCPPQFVAELHSSFKATQSSGGPPMSPTSSPMSQPRAKSLPILDYSLSIFFSISAIVSVL
ncbi:hypothetical protein CRG98_005042 [Punica granatum]|uniref:Uncharacterized protein n=1 Tax=Punica granatum TaxID=22663 RepID=A0A2I0L1Z1_PUNGR|nr:hypothetical protein CRG98_005042 [Punica granatum]